MTVKWWKHIHNRGCLSSGMQELNPGSTASCECSHLPSKDTGGKWAISRAAGTGERTQLRGSLRKHPSSSQLSPQKSGRHATSSLQPSPFCQVHCAWSVCYKVPRLSMDEAGQTLHLPSLLLLLYHWSQGLGEYLPPPFQRLREADAGGRHSG